MGGLEHESTRVANVVHGRIQPGKDAGVSRGREGRVGYGVLEEDAFVRNLIEIGSLDIGIAVASEPIRTQRVDRYENQVQLAATGTARGFTGR
jgi:hypothetical protein